MSRLLGERKLVGELMDDPDIEPRVHVRALEGLARLNRLSAAAANAWRALEPLFRDAKTRAAGRPVRLLDVASGSGDIAIGIARRARDSGLDLELSACDISPVAVEQIRERAHSIGVPIEAFVADALSGDLGPPVDVVMCSLFLHHLSEERARRLVRSMARTAQYAAVACDLRRSNVGFALAATAPRLCTMSNIVHTDAVRSVRAAFTVGEARSLGRSAGLEELLVSRIWPQRFTIAWRGLA